MVVCEKRSFKPREDRGGEKRPYTPREDLGGGDKRLRHRHGGDRLNYNRDDACPAARSSDRKFGDKSSIRRANATVRSGPIPRGEGFRKARCIRPRGDRPERAWRRQEVFLPWCAGPWTAQGDFGDRPQRGDPAVAEARGRFGSPGNAISSPATVRGVSTSRVSTSPVTTSRAKTAPPAIVRSASGRNSIALGKTAAIVRNSTARVSAPKAAPTGGNDRGSEPGEDCRAARTRTPAGFLPNVRRSAAVAPGRAHDRIGARAVLEGKENPASASQSGVARGLCRRDAEDGSPQAALPSTAASSIHRLDVTANDGHRHVLPPRERTRVVDVPQAARLDDHARRSGRAADCSTPVGRPAAAGSRSGQLRLQHRRPAAVDHYGGLARAPELPDTSRAGRRYRVRAHGEVTQAQPDELVEVDGVKYGSIDATPTRPGRQQPGWCLRSAKARTAKSATTAHLGLGEPVDPVSMLTASPPRARSRRSKPASCASSSAKRSLPCGCRFQPADARRCQCRAGRRRRPARQKAVQAARQERADC